MEIRARTVFSHRLAVSRRARRLTQQQLAEKLVVLGENIQRSTIGHYEQGISVPDLSGLASIAKVLDVTTDFLLGLEDRPSRRT